MASPHMLPQKTTNGLGTRIFFFTCTLGSNSHPSGYHRAKKKKKKWVVEQNKFLHLGIPSPQKMGWGQGPHPHPAKKMGGDKFFCVPWVLTHTPRKKNGWGQKFCAPWESPPPRIESSPFLLEGSCGKRELRYKCLGFQNGEKA